jgi:hypothetical protein
MKNLLKKYKPYLDMGSNEGLRYQSDEKSRYASFSLCLDEMLKITNPNILELGTCRSFVDGKFIGCNSDDIHFWNKDDISKWDWGAGCFSLIFGQIPGCKLTTLDLIGSHIARCKIMTDSLNIKCEHIISDSLLFLQNTTSKFDLIYLDTGDMWPIKPTEELQLKEAQIIVERNLLNVNGILLIDDVLNGTPREQGDINNKYGKSTLSIPYLLSNGFKLSFEGYQYILHQ